jgi:hypothetical protein
MDYPKMVYRGVFASKAALEAAWNTQAGITQKLVNSAAEQEAALAAGFVEQPIDMIRMPAAAPVAPAAPPAPIPAFKRDEPLNVKSAR